MVNDIEIYQQNNIIFQYPIMNIVANFSTILAYISILYNILVIICETTAA